VPMTKADRTRQHIIEKTAPLFNCKGFDGTSLTELTEVTGLTKGALYGNFTDKEEIALAAFRYSMGKVKELVNHELMGAITCKDQLLALLSFYSKYVFNPPIAGGCPLLNTAIEADDHHTSMRRVVVKELLQAVNFIRDLIQDGIKKKEFRPDIDASEVAYTIFCSVEGALMFSRVERSREPMDLIVGHCKKILHQISN
jgi:TetR/AcrR family transcriptional regulator, transcriptional repressor for nem operon